MPRDGALLDILEDFAAPIDSLAFSPDGELLVAGTHAGAIQVRRVWDGVLQDVLEGHTDWVTGLAFSGDGRQLASGS